MRQTMSPDSISWFSKGPFEAEDRSWADSTIKTICLFCGVYGILGSLVFWYFHLNYLVPLCIGVSLLYLGCGFWYKRNFLFSPFTVMLVSNISLAYFTARMGLGSGVQYLFYSCSGFNFLLFSTRTEKLKLFTALMVSVFFLVILTIPNLSPFGPPLLSPEQQHFIRSVTYPVPFILFFAFIFLMQKAYRKADSDIRNGIFKLQNKKHILSDVERIGKIGYWEMDRETGKVWWSDELYEIWGVPRSVSLHSDLTTNLYSKEFQVEFDRAISKSIRNGTHEEVIFQSKDGHLWLKAVVYGVVTSLGKPLIRGTVQDITELKLSELERERQQHQLEKIVKSGPGLFYQFIDHGGGKESMRTFSEKGVRDLLEVSKSELEADISVLYRRIHPDDLSELMASMRKSRDSMSSWYWTGRLQLDSKKIKWVRCMSEPNKNHDGTTSWDGIIIDISIQKNLEQQLDHERLKTANTSKLASLGQMAGGIAHEINNPLAIIDGYSRRLKRLFEAEVGTSQDAEKIAQRLVSTSGRIKRIVSGLMNLSQEDISESFETSTVESIIDETIDICKGKFAKGGVSLTTDYIVDRLVLSCKPTEISQVLLNLLNNSFDAIQNNNDKWVRIEVNGVGKFVEISVTDSGHGIPKETASRLFEPFFTTKEPGSGTGLGLSLSLGIIQKHHGRLLLDTASPNTKFVIRLPLRPRLEQEEALTVS